MGKHHPTIHDTHMPLSHNPSSTCNYSSIHSLQSDSKCLQCHTRLTKPSPEDSLDFHKYNFPTKHCLSNTPHAHYSTLHHSYSFVLPNLPFSLFLPNNPFPKIYAAYRRLVVGSQYQLLPAGDHLTTMEAIHTSTPISSSSPSQTVAEKDVSAEPSVTVPSSRRRLYIWLAVGFIAIAAIAFGTFI